MSVSTVSVIMPCYNASGFLRQSLGSVMAQGRDDVQVLVVDDGSDDREELRAIVGDFGESVALLEGPHRGLASTRNRGLEAASGEYVAFLDADDEWRSGFLDRQIGELERTGADLVYCDAELFGESASGRYTFMDLYPSKGEATATSVIMRRCNVVTSSVVARTEAVREVGNFDSALEYGEDFDLWLRMLISGARFTYHTDPLIGRRIHHGNMSQDSVGMMENVIELTDRYSGDIPLSSRDRRLLHRRQRASKGALHHALALRALDHGDDPGARREFWLAARANPSARRVLVATVFALAPKLAAQLRDRRRGRARGERA